MRTTRTILLAGLLCVLSNQLFAHALWIETDTYGKAGQKQTVKVYYGEYATGEREETGKWYSDVKDFTLWLVGPDEKKIQLATVAGHNFYEGSFTPGTEGVYTLLVSHEPKDLGGTTKYHFLAAATVAVGKPGAANVLLNSNILKASTERVAIHKLNSPLKIKAWLNNAAAAKKTVSVFSPAGWSKELQTDENGVVEFTPLWPGRYLAEVSNYEQVAGTHQGNSYEAVWQGATYSFEVK